MGNGYIDLPVEGGGGGSGTVTSISFTASPASVFDVSGSPITTSGTIALSMDNQTTNKVLASPNGSTGQPSFRALVASDIPSLAYLSSTLTSAHIFVGNGSNVATDVAAGGEVTLANTGAFTLVNSAVIGKVLTGYSSGAGTVASTDTILQAIQKLNGNSALNAPLANPTFTGSIIFGNYHVEPSEVNDGNSSTAQTIDFSTGSAHKSTLTGSVTYTFSNPQVGGSYVLRVLTGAGSFAVTWPATVKWPLNVAPTVTTTASRMDLFNFYWDGTNYWGSFVQNYTP